MTKEEALEILRGMKYPYNYKKNKMIITNVNEENEALLMAISALEQESSSSENPNKSEIPTSCDDAISRERVHQMLDEYMAYRTDVDVKELHSRVEELPSVQPSRKGHWITENNIVKCSECGRIQRDCRFGHTNYCNHCGALMYER